MENTVLFVLGLLLVGAGLIEIGILIPKHLNDEINDQIIKNEVIVEGNKYYTQRFMNNTQSKSSEVFQDFWMWNYTNPMGTIKGMKPIPADEIGPFVFRKYYVKFDITFDDDTVTSKSWKYFEYRSDLSDGLRLENTIICSPDVPFQMLIQNTRFNATIQGALGQMFPLYAIQCRTAMEWFAGYIEMTPAGIPIPFPGYLQNVTSIQVANQTTKFDSWNTGTWDQYQLYNIINSQGLEAEVCWAKPQAVHASDTSQFPLGLTSNIVLQTYLAPIHRTIKWNYDSHSDVYGLSTLKYKMDQETFLNSTLYPPNANFYQNGYDGFLNLTSCLGFSNYWSQPHFYGCDSSFGEIFTPPITSDNQDLSFIEIEPNTGFPIDLSIQFQQNRYLEIPTGFEQLYPVGNTLLPVLYSNIHSKISTSNANDLSDNIYTTRDIADVIWWLGIVTGSFICGVALLIFIRVQFRHRRRKLLLKRSMRQSSRQRLLIDRENANRTRRLTAT